MAQSSRKDIQLAPAIRSLLAGLRWRIRLYVWLEGIAIALLWLGLTFWAGLALDYLPVLLGASEMPVWARAVLLLLIGTILALILYYWILRRTLVRLADHSMAVVLERRFSQFNESLVTAVEMSEQPGHADDFSSEMLDHAGQEALQLTDDVRLRDVFNFRPLLWKIAIAVLLIVPVGVFYTVNARAFETWVNRIYLLRDQPWPRNARIELVGIEVQRTTVDAGQAAAPTLRPFQGGRVKVARGATIIVRVRADAAAAVVPDKCTIAYRTEERDRGRVDMKKIGRPRGGYQSYTYDGKPFKAILSSVDFDVVGYDHRIGSYRIQVVDNPAVVQTQLDCTFPAYMVDEKLSLWLPRTLDLTGNTQLPLGTQIKIRCRANKPLQEVRILEVATGERKRIELSDEAPGRERFAYEIPNLTGNATLEVTLLDTDGVITDRPHRIFIGGIPDEPPRLNVALKGIGTAVTPDVVVPANGTVEDDYGVVRAWFDVLVDDANPRQFEIPIEAAGSVNGKLDFREQRGLDGGLELRQGNKVVLSVKAADKYDLGEAPNIGSGDVFQLEVVSPQQLLAILERRELGLQRRFEQVIEEVTEMRDSLGRVQSDLDRGKKTADEPGDDPPATGGDDPADKPLDPEQAAARARSLRLLRVQRAVVQSEKSAQEVLGVGASFDDIRAELINNRVDTEDRKQRLQNQIAEPLTLIARNMFPELNRLLKELEGQLDDPQAAPPLARQTVQQADDILAELDSVLQKMLELETYNELIDIVRDLISDQQRLIEQTEVERKKQALELLK